MVQSGTQKCTGGGISMGFGFSFWGLVLYAVIFISGYFIWAIKENAKEEEEGN